MNSDWPLYKAIDLQKKGVLRLEDGNHGEYRPRPNEFGSGDIAFIRASDINYSYVDFQNAARINDTAFQRIRKGIGRPGDIIFSHKGTVGKLARTPKNAPAFVCSPQTTFWRTLDESILDRRFLYYFMASKEFRDQWFCRKGETDMADYVSLTAQRQLYLKLPRIKTQKTIASILGALDDKIELNSQMNQTLELMAQALFKSWFVDFDPVVARAAGKKPFSMSDEVAALFPDKFEDSELGVIPKGWHIKKMSEICKPQYGYTTSAKNTPVGPRLLRITDMNKLPWIEWHNVPFCEISKNKLEKCRLEYLDVLVSRMADPGKAAIVELDIEAVFASYLIRLNTDIELSYYLFYFLRSENYVDYAKGASSGTVQKSMNAKIITAVPMIIPKIESIREFDKQVVFYRKQINSNIQENYVLSLVRDTLLPKLISGEVQIKNAEKMLAEAI